MSTITVPFNKPHMTGRELDYISAAHAAGHLSGDGIFTKRCQEMLKQATGASKVLLTHSCTAALEMAALLLELAPGDEVIMPSYTFVSTANAFVLQGAKPVFVDIRPDTLNIDEALIEQAITSRTRAICVVHYAGVACEMDKIFLIAERHGLKVIEDAAQAVASRYRGRALGAIGDIGAFSFHETKNVISGEGGALLLRDENLAERAEIIREKGTNRSRFFRGQVDKYTWVDKGSSYLPGEIIAAFLAAQIEETASITKRRLSIWDRYHAWAYDHETVGRLRRPITPVECSHNAHMYYMLLPDLDTRTRFIHHMRGLGIGCVFHYIPLHAAPAGLKFGQTHGEMNVTTEIADRLVRMPLWLGVEEHMDDIFEAADSFLRSL